MYNRILNRPMFKRGGDVIDSQGTGITSGLDTPRNNYAGGGRTIGGGAFTGTPLGNRTGFAEIKENIFEGIDVSVPQSTKDRAFWSGIGAGFGDPSSKTLGEMLWKSRAAQDAIIGPAEASAAQRKFDLQKGGIEKEFDRETALFVTKEENKAKIEAARIAAESTATAQRIKLLNQKFLKDDGTIDTTNPDYISQRDIIINNFNKLEAVSELARALIAANVATDSADALAKALQIVMGAELALKPEKKAQGGRIGYQMGTTNQGVQPIQPMQASLNVDETIKTPGGTMQEDVSVQEQTQSSIGIPYQEFRAKMPPEVDDEIVQLIYYNEDAFADFAQITSQADVYAFNNKWGVSLVLPMDTETT